MPWAGRIVDDVEHLVFAADERIVAVAPSVHGAETVGGTRHLQLAASERMLDGNRAPGSPTSELSLEVSRDT